jgi:hypothetical protein
MLPTQDTNHLAEGLGMRIGQYLTDKQLAALLTAFLIQIQDAEDMLWDVINSTQWIKRAAPVAGTAQGQASGPPDQALLQLADLVGCPVGTLTTWQLQFLVGIWLLARKSHGLSEDLIGILAAAFGKGNFSYQEFYPLAYVATAFDVADATLIAPLTQALKIARPPCVSPSVINWGSWPGATFYLGGYGTSAWGSGGAGQGSGLGGYGTSAWGSGVPGNAKGLLMAMEFE